MKILAITGSPRKKGNSQKLIQDVVEVMRQTDSALEIKTLRLSDLKLDYCSGCCACIKKGENLCPHQGSVAVILDRIAEHDAILFASPVYAHQITALMKNFIDHLAFLFHRPQFAGKPALVLATTDGSGLKETLKYLNFAATGWGFAVTGKIGIMSPVYQWSASYKAAITKQIAGAVRKMEKMVKTGLRPQPSLYELAYFRAMRQKARFIACDRNFWTARGWFDQAYYFNVPIHPVKLAIANLLEKLLGSMTQIMLKKALKPAETAQVLERVHNGTGNDYDKELALFLEAAPNAPLAETDAGDSV